MEKIMATVNVSNFSELKTAIEDSTSTEINVLNDITFSGGAKVNLSKSSLVIDFNNHVVTDANNQNLTDTIYVANSTNTIIVTIKNATWSGRNYYGVVGVYSGNTNTTVELENIIYIGPQFIFNKNGVTNIKDCTITIEKNNSSTNPQEFCEANRINIIGNVKVVSYSTTDAVIWFSSANAQLTVNENANFDVSAPYTYFLYSDVSPILLFKQNSSTTISTKSGLFYASGNSSHIAQSFTVEENASFVAHKQESNSIPMFKCLSNFTLKNNSSFRLFSEAISSTVLMYFGQTANIEITTPKNVVLYNRGGYIFNFSTGSASNPNLIKITTEMLRLWNIATYPLSSAGELSDIPTTQYFKKNYAENLTLSIKASNSQLLSVENNLESDDTGYPITTTTKLLSSSVISMGHITLDVNEINDATQTISGTTEDFANVMIDFDDKSITIVADLNGNFSTELSEKLAINTNVLIFSNKHFLTKSLTFKTGGSLTITNLPQLDFKTFTSPNYQNIVYRQNPNWNIQIKDTRLEGKNWYLYAHIINPLTCENNKLDDALIFKNQNVITKLSQTPILIYTGEWNEQNQTTNISWDNLEGFLLKLNSNKNLVAGDYQTEIQWQLTTSPLN